VSLQLLRSDAAVLSRPNVQIGRSGIDVRGYRPPGE